MNLKIFIHQQLFPPDFHEIPTLLEGVESELKIESAPHGDVVFS